MDKIKSRLVELVEGGPHLADPRTGITELASILLDLVSMTGEPAADPGEIKPDAPAA